MKIKLIQKKIVCKQTNLNKLDDNQVDSNKKLFVNNTVAIGYNLKKN